jgi:hypothetical protein
MLSLFHDGRQGMDHREILQRRDSLFEQPISELNGYPKSASSPKVVESKLTNHHESCPHHELAGNCIVSYAVGKRIEVEIGNPGYAQLLSQGARLRIRFAIDEYPGKSAAHSLPQGRNGKSCAEKGLQEEPTHTHVNTGTSECPDDGPTCFAPQRLLWVSKRGDVRFMSDS